MCNIEVYFLSKVEQLKKYCSGGYFVWWLTQQDCERITSLQQQTLPEYISSELSSRRGRSGRCRLWVASGMGLPVETNNIPKDMGDIGGIVIRGADKKYLPVNIGRVTKL